MQLYMCGCFSHKYAFIRILCCINVKLTVSSSSLEELLEELSSSSSSLEELFEELSSEKLLYWI